MGRGAAGWDDGGDCNELCRAGWELGRAGWVGGDGRDGAAGLLARQSAAVGLGTGATGACVSGGLALAGGRSGAGRGPMRGAMGAGRAIGAPGLDWT